ncbi:hypothetical protein EPA93_05520 [Ktedonosporobacter rubrisoli]|uniref:Uncharacterized protein n=1 Tax=Ktedonosporobacter rubrisoli TaxID=2509675 RepID=A0A4P6JKI1_KTERU|nr:hypothetical protein [Ktedonosporobacter rubrisoli]QBD75490.1 hypothetical protein EPA93_05520 [Ktedonosporobacter rubrisoli]
MQTLLNNTDALISKFAPLSHLLDSLAQRVAPQGKARAGALACVHCYYYCTEARCSHHQARRLHCYDQCDGSVSDVAAGCVC